MSVKVMRFEDDQGHLTFFSNQRHALRRLDGQQSNLQIYLKIFVMIFSSTNYYSYCRLQICNIFNV